MTSSQSTASPSDRQAYWSQHIDQWKASGLSRTAYCRRESLSLQQLCYWINKSTKSNAKAATSDFIAVRTPQTPAADFCLTLPSGLTLGWSGAVDPDYLGRVVARLAS